MLFEVNLTKRDLLAFELYHRRVAPALRKKYWQSYLIWCGSFNLFSVARGYLQGTTPSQIALEMVITALVVLLLRQFFFLLGQGWRLRKNGWAAYRDQSSSAKRVSLSAEKITITNLDNGKRSDFTWGLIKKLAETRQHLFIYTSASNAIVIPKRAFATADLLQQCKQEVLALAYQACTTVDLRWHKESPVWHWCKVVANGCVVFYVLFEVFLLTANSLGVTELLALARHAHNLDNLQLLWQAALDKIGQNLLSQIFYWLCFTLATVLLILPHETAHAVVGQWVGLRVFRMSFGFGPTIWQTSVGSLNVKFNLIPLGGATHLAAPLRYNSRLGLWLTVFAGPGVHLALHLVFRLLAKDPALNELFFHSALPGVAVFMHALVNANFYLAVSNLIPLRLTTADGMAITDGYQLLRIPFYGEKEMLDYRIIGILAEANELKHSGQFAATQALYETWLTHYPDHELLRAARAHLFVDLGDYASAREELCRLLATPRAQQQTMFRLSLLHSLAYVNALLNDPSHLHEADEYSSSILLELPNVGPAMGLRGAVLLRLHETQEGLALLKQSVQRASNQLSLAKYRCWLAIGHAMENDFVQASQYLELARECGIPFHFLRQAETEVERLYQNSQPHSRKLSGVRLAHAA